MFFAGLDAAGGDGGFDVAPLCAEHPELAAELRELFACYRDGLAALAARGAGLPAVIDGRYEVRREIDSGGMGTVLEVWDRRLRRALAMKITRGVRGATDAVAWRRRQSRLRNEAQVLGQLVHPGIVPVHDTGESGDGDAYFTMQLVCGRNFGEILAEAFAGSARWTRVRLVEVIGRVCEAVAYAHSKGVLHRDLKPSNVMVGAFGETYVLDWGLAKVSSAWAAEPPGDRVRTERGEADARAMDPLATLVGEVVGTPAYMAPEQALGDRMAVDLRADVYAVGAILYHVLAGRRPYSDCDDPRAAMRAVRAAPPAPLARLARSAPPELVAISNRAMDRDPRQRYPTMGAMAGDLRAFLDGRAVRAHRTGALVELQKWVRRNKGAAAAVLAVLAGLTAVLALQARANRVLRVRDYRNKVVLAGHAYQSDDIRAMRELLAAAPVGLRGWEWHATRRLTDSSELVLAGHSDVIQCAALAPDERVLATGSRDRSLRLWDLQSGETTRRWTFDAAVTGVAFVRPDHLVASVGENLVELGANGDQRRSQPLGVGNAVLALAPDRSRLLLGIGGRVELWRTDPLAPAQVLVEGLFGISRVAWSADGRLALVAARDRETDGARASLVRVYDADTGALRHALAGHGQWIASVAASADGRWLASSSWDGHVLLRDLSTGARRGELPRVWPGPVALVWDGAGHLLAGGAPSIEEWDVESLQLRRRLVGHQGQVTGLHACGARIISIATDGVVRVWQRGGGRGGIELPSSSAGRSLGLRPGTDEFAVGSAAGNVEIWSAATRTRARVTAIPCRRTLVAYTSDGSELVTADRDGVLCRWDARSDARRGAVPAHDGPIAGLATHPAAPRCVTAGVDGRVRLWDLQAMRSLWDVAAGNREWPQGAHGCAFSADGTRVAAGANDGRLRILDADSGALLGELRAEGVDRTYASPQFAPDGSVVLARIWGRAARLAAWSTATGGLLWSTTGDRLAFASPRFTADGTRVTACTETGALVVFAADTGERMVTLPGPSAQRVMALAWWGDLLIAASERGLRFWDGTPESP